MTEQAVIQWITAYGYFGIFFLLIFGIIGLPIPDEWLLVFSGYLAFKEVLGVVPTLIIAAAGSAGGLTVSYLLGRSSGNYVVRKYGHLLSIDEAKILRVQQWFQTLGRWVLVIGPFIPGVRNLMGYVAGAARLRPHVFMRFAYLGAMISSTTFVACGYFLGQHINWNYSRLPLIALVCALLITFSGAPLRLLLRMRRRLAAVAPKPDPSWQQGNVDCSQN
jgi:membrane protein DedA with SNARE-associated domain